MITNDNKIKQKVAQIFCCELCDYTTSRKSNFDKHILSHKHKSVTNDNILITNDNKKQLEKVAQKFYCEKCDYYACTKQHFEYHKLTLKHKTVEKCLKSVENKQNENTCQNKKIFKCSECDKIFQYRSGLSRHKKTCKKSQYNDYDSDDENYIDDKCDLKTIVLHMLKKDEQMNSFIIEQSKQMLQLAQNIGNNNNNYSNYSHNKTFNLQVFLNETCKDAMNIMDFVNSIQLDLNDLERVGKLGYVDGISDIIIKNLKALDITKRPVHCTDSKREVLYVKDDEKWEKEDEEKNKMKKVVRYVAHKNIKLIPEFKEKHPDCSLSHSKTSDQYNKIIIESMGGPGNHENENNEKIIKKIAKEVTINKYSN